MKRIICSLSIILIICSNVFSQTPAEIEKAMRDYPGWATAKRFPLESSTHVFGIGYVFEMPTPNSDGSVSPSNLSVKIAGMDNQMYPGPVTSIERGINTETIDWKAIFNRPVQLDANGKPTRYYKDPLPVVYHIYGNDRYITL